MSVRLRQIVEALGGTIEGGGGDVEILRIAPLDSAEPGDLAFLSNPRYRQQLAASRAACVIVAPAMREEALARGACIVAQDPYAYFARATQLWKRLHGRTPAAGVHPSAVVDPDAFVDPSARIGPLCVVERGAHVGAGTVLTSRITVGEDCRIGERCLLHPGVVIGADGFGFAPDGGAWTKIEQLGAVRIGDDVEIGANTCIDRGALDDTVIEDGVKLDNLVQIGHNVRIGRHTAVAGCTGVSGSTRIGAHCMIGGAAMILGHLEIADGVQVSPGTAITRSVLRPGLYSGMFPFDENAKWEKNAATLRQLHALRTRIMALEEQIRKNGPTAHIQ